MASTKAPRRNDRPPTPLLRPKSINPKKAITKASPSNTVEANRTREERRCFFWPGCHWRCAFVSRYGRHDSLPVAYSGLIVILLWVIGEKRTEVIVAGDLNTGVSVVCFGAQ